MPLVSWSAVGGPRDNEAGTSWRPMVMGEEWSARSLADAGDPTRQGVRRAVSGAVEHAGRQRRGGVEAPRLAGAAGAVGPLARVGADRLIGGDERRKQLAADRLVLGDV